MDEISAYNYLIDQKVITLGTFVQSDWELTETLIYLVALDLISIHY